MRVEPDGSLFFEADDDALPDWVVIEDETGRAMTLAELRAMAIANVDAGLTEGSFPRLRHGVGAIVVEYDEHDR